jgi:predicted NUDIX family NTP pyrophosphohydrolase
VKKISGGLILYNRQICNQIKFLIAHPGGPFLENRDLGWWTIPKGEPEENEDVFDVAIRKFEEETGMKPNGPYMDLGNILQKNGKRVYAWAFEEDWEQERVPMCNEITLEYPKGSGRLWTFPEIDQAMMMNAEEAKKKLRSEQTPLIDRHLNHIQDKT